MTILNNFSGKTDGNAELNVLKDDIAALKSNGANFVHHVNENAGNLTRDGMNKIMSKAESGMSYIENQVKAKPTQSMLIAFATGLVANYLLSSRR
jgi:hypothetical protein